jgi:hypothetical protein
VVTRNALPVSGSKIIAWKDNMWNISFISSMPKTNLLEIFQRRFVLNSGSLGTGVTHSRYGGVFGAERQKHPHQTPLSQQIPETLNSFANKVNGMC